MINYNHLHEVKEHIENMFYNLQEAHQDIIDIIEDADCLDGEKYDEVYSTIKEYEAEIEQIKANFMTLKSKNKKLQSCLSQTRMMKKLRVTKLESQIYQKHKDEIDDADLPF